MTTSPQSLPPCAGPLPHLGTDSRSVASCEFFFAWRLPHGFDEVEHLPAHIERELVGFTLKAVSGFNASPSFFGRHFQRIKANRQSRFSSARNIFQAPCRLSQADIQNHRHASPANLQRNAPNLGRTAFCALNRPCRLQRMRRVHPKERRHPLVDREPHRSQFRAQFQSICGLAGACRAADEMECSRRAFDHFSPNP
jgi:hypothetical protein